MDSWYWFNFFGKTKFRFKQNHKRGIMFWAGNGFCFLIHRTLIRIVKFVLLSKKALSNVYKQEFITFSKEHFCIAVDESSFPRMVTNS